MELNQKLQELRKQKGLTQDDLAQALYVSRTAVSKWESGRGYPNIESLKAIAEFFKITVDELLSGDELLSLAEADTKQKEKHIYDIVFGLLDCCALMLFFLPFFGQKTNGVIKSVSVLLLTEISSYLQILYFVFIIAIALFGILRLTFQNCNFSFWMNFKNKISLVLSVVAALLFIISSQPYAAMFIFVFLVIKALMLIKW